MPRLELPDTELSKKTKFPKSEKLVSKDEKPCCETSFGGCRIEARFDTIFAQKLSNAKESMAGQSL